MTTDESAELPDEPRFITGISDYCDYWCERCAFTAHCSNFAEQPFEGERSLAPTDLPEDAENILDSPHSTFAIAEELIKCGAANQDSDIHSSESQAELDKANEERERKYAEARAHPLSRAATAYAHSVYYWFDRRDEALQARIKRARKNDEINSDVPFPEEVEDAIEVIHWHQHQAGALLNSIFTLADNEEAQEIFAPLYDGQMKTVLIGLDHSLLAWGKVQMFWPERAEEMMRLTSLASELRWMLELAFPNARDFIRPGFDDASTLLM